MGTSLRDFLDSADRKSGVSTQTPLDTWAGGGNDDAQKLGVLKRTVDPSQAQRSARILRLTGKTGLDSAFVDQNLDEIEKEAQRYDFDPDKFKVNNPKLASWLGENIHHMNVAKADLKKLSYLERQARYIKEQYELGSLTTELAALGEKSALKGLTFKERKRLFELKVRTRSALTADDYGIGKVFADIPGAVANQLPIQGKTYMGGALGAGAGALSGAVTGLVAGSPGGPAGSALGTATGATAGAVIGLRVGVGVAAARMEMGLAFNDYEDIRDENGRPLDRDVALGAAIAVGAANGLLEMVSAEALLKTVPGLRSLTREGIKKALATPTGRAAVTRWARGIGQTALTEGATETIQSLITSGGGVLATAASSENPEDRQNIFDKWFSSANVKQALTEGVVGAKAGGGTSAVTSSASLGIDMHNVKRARQAGKFFEALGDVTSNAQLTKELPEKMREVVERITKNGPVETVYAPVQAFNEYWEKKEINPADVAEQIGIREQYDEAVLNGTDIPIPTSLYAEKLAPTEHNSFFTRELRTSPDAMNLREVEELNQTMTEEEAKLSFEDMPEDIKTGATAVVESLTQQLVATGQDEVTARTSSEALYGRLYRALVRYGVKSERLNEVFGNISVTRSTLKTSNAPAPVQPLPPSTGAIGVIDSVPTEGYVDLFHVTDNDSLRAIQMTGVINNELSKGNVQGYPAAVTGMYGWASLERARFEIDRLSEMGGDENDWAIVHIRVPVDSPQLTADEDAGAGATWQESLGEGGSAAVRGGVTRAEIQRVYTNDANFGTLFQGGPSVVSGLANIPKLLGGFFSKAEQTIQQKMPTRASVKDIRNILKDIKAEERYWLGLDKFLEDISAYKGEDTVIEKEFVMNYLMAHRIEIVEIGARNAADTDDAVNDAFDEFIRDWTRDRIRQNAYITHNPDTGNWEGVMRVLEPWEDELKGKTFYGSDRGEVVHLITDAIETELNSQYEVHEDATRFWNERLQDIRDEQTQEEGGDSYEDYTLPGGSNYRIIKLTLPGLIPPDPANTIYGFRYSSAEGFQIYDESNPDVILYTAADAAGRDRWIRDERLRQVTSRRNAVFVSNHFSDTNIVVHVRLKDRTLPDGTKMLFVEEIQSDWHQKGRDRGYNSPDRDRRLTEIEIELERVSVEEEHAAHIREEQVLQLAAELERLNTPERLTHDYHVYGAYHIAYSLLVQSWPVSLNGLMENLTYPENFNEYAQKFDAAHKKQEALAIERRHINAQRKKLTNVVPDAPWKRTWHELALKRMIRHAAEGGYDSIGWTTGDQQADRYDLSTQVDGIQWSAGGNGNIDLVTIHNWPEGGQPEVGQFADEDDRLAANMDILTTEEDKEYKWYVTNPIYGSIQTFKTLDEAIHHRDTMIQRGDSSKSRIETIPLSDLTDWVGTSIAKEIRTKAEAGEVTGVISGDQLKMGGHGMRVFYDEIVPKFLRDFTKKYGGVIEDTKLGSGREVQYDAQRGKYFIYDESLDMVIAQYDTLEEANEDAANEIGAVHSLRLTPELKQAALRDEFTLYQRKHADTDTPSFKRWFGNSKIVDEDGEPLVVVHGTTAKFRAFDVNRPSDNNVIEIGSHFGTPKQALDRVDPAAIFALSREQGRRMLKGYLRIQNPLRVRDKTDHSPSSLIPQLLDLGILSNREVAELDQLRMDAMRDAADEANVSPSSIMDEIKFQETVTGEWIAEAVPDDELSGFINHNAWMVIQSTYPSEKAAKATVLKAVTKSLKEFKDDPMQAPGLSDTFLAGELAVVTTLREMLMDKGYDGIVYLNRHEGIGQPVGPAVSRVSLYEDSVFRALYPDASDSYIIFEPAQFKSQYNAGTFSLRDPDMYKQGEEDAPKGSINFEGGVNINLFEGADLSTFIHETGHFYLEVLRALSTDNEAIKRDHDIIMNWLGAGEGVLLSREQHEMFARGFEAYLMEGRAPVPELRAAFSRFRAWLLTIYRSLTNLDVQLTPEVRGVFDRLVATEDEITTAQMAIGPMFQDPRASGLTEEQALEYETAIAQQKAAAEEELTQKLLADVKREQNRQYKLQRDKIKQEVTDEVNQDPAWVALSALQRNQLPDGTPLMGDNPIPKLNRKAVAEVLGSDVAISGLPKYITQREGGMLPEEAASIFGFSSAMEMLEALPMNDTAKAHIERLTDERMKKEQGDLYTDGRLPVEAAKAVHNVERSKVLHKELQLLATNRIGAFKGMIRKLTQAVPTIDAVREEAENIILHKQMRDIKPSLYARAERQAAKAAMEAFLAGDVELAFKEKERELHNHELYRAAVKATEREDTVVNHMAKFNRKPIREKLGRAGADYLEQIDGLRQRFDFRVSVSNKTLEEKTALAAFVDRMADLGLQIDVPAKLLNELNRKHYRELTYKELNEVYDTVRQIEHLSNLKNKLLANKKRREFNEAKMDIIGSIYENHATVSEPLNLVPTTPDRVKAWTRKAVAAHTKMEFLFEYLDGIKSNGPVWQHLFKPLADAEDIEHRLAHEAAKKMHEIFGQYPLEERARWYYNRIRVQGFDTEFTKANLLTVALNWGNEGNRQALRDSHGWTDDQIQLLLDQLDERDWKVVQQIWDYLDSYWPAVAELEAELKGLPPERVEPVSIVTKFGTFKGGYYPIVFDSKLSWRQAVIDAKQETRELFGGRWSRAMTRHGHTEERVGSGGKPIRLDISGLTEHVANVIHDLSHRRAIIDIGRLTDDAEVRQAIESTMGRDMYRQINPWLVNIARDRRSDFANPIEGMLGRMRAGASVVNMGWKITTGIAQLFGYTGSVKELGVKYGMHGMRDTYGQPWKIKSAWEFATTRSEFMHSRLTTFDRDARDALKSLGVEGTSGGPLAAVSVYGSEVLHSWFILSGYMDMGVSLPTWMGGYRKAMDGAVPGIKMGDEEAAIGYADKVVRQTQGVGSAKDLALVQQGSESFRLFTMFYSYFNGLFNQFVKVKHEYQMTGNRGQLIASLALLWFLPAALSELAVGRGPDDKDDPLEWAKWLAKVELLYPTQSVILLRDITNGMTKFGYDPSAAFDAAEAVSKSGRAVATRITGDKDEFKRTDLKNVVQAVGYFAHLPTKQVWLSSEYLYDWMTGDEQPSSFHEGVWRTLVTGKPRK